MLVQTEAAPAPLNGPLFCVLQTRASLLTRQVASALLAISLVASGCLHVHRIDGLDPCPGLETPPTLGDVRMAYDGIEGVAPGPQFASDSLLGEYLRPRGYEFERVVLQPSGRATLVLHPDVSPVLLRSRYEGEWMADPNHGQVVVVFRSWVGGAACAYTERFDVVEVDGRVWLVEGDWRIAFESWLALHRRGEAYGYIINGDVIDGYIEGSHGAYVQNEAIYVRQAEG